MKKLVAAVVAFLLLGVGGPLMIATVLTPSSATAAQEARCTTAPMPPTGSWRPPFQQAYTLTSSFGPRTDPIDGTGKTHTGQDLVSLPGPGPVVAASAGTVTVGPPTAGYGTHVQIEHGGGVTTLYGHLAALAPGIATGTVVRIGQQLGTEGTSGRSTGLHLHFEIHQDGVAIDPAPFMLAHGAPLDGRAVAPSSPLGTVVDDPGRQQGGVGFRLPTAGHPVLNALTNPALPIPSEIKVMYVAAADRYHLPWTLLAGIGMEETAHGRNTAVSSAGAQGLMQFMPATWEQYGVDGSGDGRADILNDADSAMTAANYLTASGVTTGGADGVRRAIFAYNHADWYVNDVLTYAAAYGGGVVAGDPSDCGPGGDGNPNLPPIDNERIQTMLTWAQSHRGQPYVYGSNGPSSWDCSSFTRAAFAQIGITLPRTASAQHDWLAHGNGYKVPPGQEQPGDVVFTDSYLGPNQIGHVMLVYDPTQHLSIEAGGSHVDNYAYTRWQTHPLYSIWRVGSIEQR